MAGEVIGRGQITIAGIKDGASYTNNLLLGSGEPVENDKYLIATYQLAEKPVVGEDMTITIWGELASARTGFDAYNSGGLIVLANLQNIEDGIYRASFKWRNSVSTITANDTSVHIYAVPNNGTNDKSRIDRIKLERGKNDNPQWSPASSEMVGQDAYTVVLSNESHIFEGDTTKAIVASTSSDIIAYKGATRVAAAIGTISGMPSGMSVSTQNNGTTTAKFTVSVTTALTTKQGVLNIPVTVDGQSFTKQFSWSLSLQGRGITNVAELYAVNNSSTAPPADSAFVQSPIPQTSETNRYLWNYEKTTYSDNTYDTTQKHVIGIHGQNGEPGAGISKIENYLLASAKAHGVTVSESGWTTDASSAAATVSAEKAYLWNYEKITYTKGNPTQTQPHVIGHWGSDGSDYTPNLLVGTAEESTSLTLKYYDLEESLMTIGAGEKVTISYDYEYSNVTTGDNTEGSANRNKYRLGGEQSIKLSDGTTTWSFGWFVTLPINSTNLSGKGRLVKKLTIPEAIAQDYTRLAFYGQVVSGNVRLWNIKMERGWNDNPVWTPSAKEMLTPTITEEYYLSTSDTALSGGSWSDTKPAWVAGRYYWTRSKTTYATGKVTYSEPICVTGQAGTSVLARYSVTGGAAASEWHPAYQPGDVWMQTSSDSGNTWGAKVLVKGSNYTDNLALGSKDFKIQGGAATGITVSIGAQGELVVTAAAGNGNYLTNFWKSLNTAEIEQSFAEGDKYTISFTVKSSDSNGGVPTIYIKSGMGYYTQNGSISSEYSTIYRTGTWKKANGIAIHLGFKDCVGTYHIKNWKIEKGSNPAPQWTPHPSEMIGKDGQYRTYQWAKNTSTTTAPTSGWQDTPLTAAAGEYVWTRSGIVVPPATTPATWQTAIRLTGDTGAKGDAGSSTYKLDLTDEVKGVLCNSGGTPLSATIPTSQASVYKGSTKVTSGITYSIAQATGVSATVTAAGVVTPSALTADNATIVVQAKVDGLTLQSPISIYKVIPGSDYTPNLLVGTAESEWKEVNVTANAGSVARVPVSDLGLVAGDTVTFSVDVKTNSGKKLKARIQWYNSESDRKSTVATEYVENGEKRLTVTSTVLDGYQYVDLFLDANLTASTHTQTTTEYVRRAYFCKGSSTAWVPAASEMVGQDGVSVLINSTEVRYSTAYASQTQPAESTFTLTAIPALASGQYLWSRTTVTYSNGQQTKTYAVSRIGVNGTNGTNGKDGVNGTDYTNNLLRNSDFKDGTKNFGLSVNVTLDTSKVFERRNSVKSAQSGLTTDSWRGVIYRPNGKYYPAKPGDQITLSIWVYTEDLAGIDNGCVMELNFRDESGRITGAGSSAACKPTKAGEWQQFSVVSKVAPEGTIYAEFYCYVRRNGTVWFNGMKAEYGVNPTPVWTPYAEGASITSTSVTYAKTATSAQPADSAFTYSSIGSAGVGSGDYLWSKTEVGYSDGTSTKSYSVSRVGSDGAQGTPGAPGENGKTPYVHFAYASGITGNLPHPTTVSGFNTTAFSGAKYIGTCTDYYENDPTENVATVYEWSEYKGADGATGAAAVVYEVIPDIDNVTRSADGSLSVAKVGCTVYKTTGATARAVSNDYQLYYERHPDGASGLLTRTNGKSPQVDVLADTESIIFELRNGQIILDRERVPVFADASDLRIGTTNLILNSESFTVPASGNAASGNYSYTEKPLQLSPVTAGDQFAFRVDSIEVTKFTTKPTAFTAVIYNLENDGENTLTQISNALALTQTNREGVLTITGSTGTVYANPRLLIYAGAWGATSGNCVKYTQVMLVQGNKAGVWAKAPFETRSYVERALHDGATQVKNGLLLSSVIALGEWNTSDPENPQMTKVWSGMNGQNVSPDTPAFWAGGDMPTDETAEEDMPTYLVKMDGTGYAANRTVKFEENRLTVGENVVLDANGLSLDSDNEAKFRLSNESIGNSHVYANASTIRSLNSSGTKNMTLYLGSDKAHIATASIPSISCGTLTVGSRIEVSVSMSFSATATPLQQMLISSNCYLRVAIRQGSGNVYLASQKAYFKTDQAVGSTKMAASVSIGKKIITQATYQLEISIGNDSSYSSGMASQTVAVSYTSKGYASAQTTNQTIIGNDGIVSVWGNNVFFFNETGFLAKCGNYGIHITEEGFHYMHGGGWRNLQEIFDALDIKPEENA